MPEDKQSQTEKIHDAIQKAAGELFDFAVDRQDVKWLMERLHPEADINRTTVEYELQALKIVTVGWSVAYCLETSPLKQPLSESYWLRVRDFSNGISEAAKYMAGTDIDYFDILKTRLDMYVQTLSESGEKEEPASVIGPEFARICGNEQDLFTFMTGSKMFMSSSGRVREYLEKTDFQPV
ncbi:conserved hypothetical protein [Candidatus Desulfarcum epimagneticum]|uniref:Uncharacterized protein n=1 Tax=uncultured Desulfobacteraceae bacterium TaxID=218296 RepID=A0A484HKX0_9BACT|nr:conserved hypothetical protein [uncultured Desulfobacteraceae bacterium]